MNYDMLVLGNDDAAFEVATSAARAGSRVLNVMPSQRHSASLLARSLRRLTLELSIAAPERNRLRRTTSPALLQRLLRRAVNSEIAEQLATLRNVGVHTLRGESSFLAPGWVRVDRGAGQPNALLNAKQTVVATGVRRTLLSLSLVKRNIHGPHHLLQFPELPESIIIVGGDDFGASLAALCSTVGIHTELLTRQPETSALLELAIESGVKLTERPDHRLQPDVFPDPSATDCCSLPPVLDCRRAVGFTGHLRLDTLGIQTDEQGLLWCSSSLETWCPGVFGAGDVVGFSPDNFRDYREQAARILEAAAFRSAPRNHSRSPLFANS